MIFTEEERLRIVYLRYPYEDECRNLVGSYAERGLLPQVVGWIKEMAFFQNRYDVESMAWHGRLDAIKLLRERGFPWGWTTVHNAAHRGHIEIVKYAAANGCPWNAAPFGFRMSGKEQEAFDWLRANHPHGKT